MAATNPADIGLDHPTVVPVNYVPDTDAEPTETDEDHERVGENPPRCPACGRPLADH